MKFICDNFVCDIEKYDMDERSFVIRFFNKTKEHAEHEICDYVLVDPGFGYICLKFKGEDALLSGFLDETVFKDDNIINAAIDYAGSLSPFSGLAYIPHNVMKVKFTGSVEYNGEF